MKAKKNWVITVNRDESIALPVKVLQYSLDRQIISLHYHCESSIHAFIRNNYDN